MEGFRQAAQALLAIVLLAASAAAQTPVVNAGGIVNAADFRPASLSGGAVAQGSIFSVFGSELSAGTFDADSFPLPRQVIGVRVEVVAADMVYEAPLLHVGPEQINAVFPSDVPVGPATVRVVRDGQQSNAEPVKVVRTFPGLFETNAHQVQQQAYSNHRQEAAAQRYVDGLPEPLTLDSPASPGGDVTLWTTGVFGSRDLDDVPSALASRPTPRSPVRVFVAGSEALVSYQAPASCCAGVDQVNIRLPLDVSLGCFVPVQFIGGGLPSNIATIAIAEPGQNCPGRETDPTRVYLNRVWQDGVPSDRGSVLTGRLLLDPNEIPPLGSCQAFSRDQIVVSVSTHPGDVTAEIDGPSSSFLISQSGPAGPLGPGTYQVTVRGERPPDIRGTLSIPGWSYHVEDLPADIDARDAGLHFEWDWGVFAYASPTKWVGVIMADRRLICTVDLTAGSFTIGPESLALLDGEAAWSFGPMAYAPIGAAAGGLVVYTDLVAQTFDLGPPRLAASPVTLPNGDRIVAELATTEAERQRGLVHRAALAPDRGMLFFFPTPGIHGFWMSQTLIPLDILWLDAERRVVSISAETPPCPSGGSCPIYSPSAPAQFVLELASGEAARRNLQLGDQLDW